jgi:uncharacterized repeat protein (TIGR02543 family)
MILINCDPDGRTTTYTVTFESNGGSSEAPITDISPGATVSLPTPTRDAYTFAGWFTDDGTFQNEFTGSTPVTGDITVYAKWTPAGNPFKGTWSWTGTGTVNSDGSTFTVTSITIVFDDDTYELFETITKIDGTDYFMNIRTKGTYTVSENTASVTQSQHSDNNGSTWTDEIKPVMLYTVTDTVLSSPADMTTITLTKSVPLDSRLLGSWVKDDLDGSGDGNTAFIFKHDGTVTMNGLTSGTYTSTAMTFTIPDVGNFAGTIAFEAPNLVISGFTGEEAADLNDTYEKGGLLTLTDAPAGGGVGTNYRVYISTTEWTGSTSDNLMTDATIAAFRARTPGGSDIADGNVAPLFWNGANTGTFHVLIRQGGNVSQGVWKYKNNVAFVDGNNTTLFGFSGMSAFNYTGPE